VRGEIEEKKGREKEGRDGKRGKGGKGIQMLPPPMPPEFFYLSTTGMIRWTLAVFHFFSGMSVLCLVLCGGLNWPLIKKTH